mmetsp:Transcript_17381/g.19493  ORF Transcript_17381/g.19493 Transcript_17381/m.19493 type:complete len:80 (-) Transcript_17381:50-289(-)
MSFGGSGSPMEQKLQFEMVFGVISNCFDDCVNDFRDNQLSEGEKTCLSNCAGRSAGTQELIMQVQNEMQGSMGNGSGGF